jgi:hypothetical protein
LKYKDNFIEKARELEKEEKEAKWTQKSAK